MGKDKNALWRLFGMESLMLLDENHPSTHTQESGKQDESNNESKYDIANEKAQKAPSYSTCGPIDVSSLQTHEFKGLLKPLENREVWEFLLFCCIHKLIITDQRTKASSELQQ